MAKAKISEQKSSYLIIEKEKKEKKEDFMALLKVLRMVCEVFHKRFGFLIPVGTEDAVAVLLPVDQKEREEVRDNVLTFLKGAGSGVGIKIEFEEEKKKEEKWVPAHKMIAELLKEDSDRYTEPYAELYARGTKAPEQGIPDLLKHFEAALPNSGGYLNEVLGKAIQNLKQQQKEE